MNESTEVSIEQLEKALRISAKVVSFFGDVYLPIFSRVHSELENAKMKLENKNHVMKLVSAVLNSDGTKK